jgi:hypothetical protein
LEQQQSLLKLNVQLFLRGTPREMCLPGSWASSDAVWQSLRSGRAWASWWQALSEKSHLIESIQVWSKGLMNKETLLLPRKFQSLESASWEPGTNAIHIHCCATDTDDGISRQRH